MTSIANTATQRPCIFCNKPAKYHNSTIMRYTCTEDHTDCNTFKVIQEHISTCDLPTELHSIYPKQNKCFQLLYDICVSRGYKFGKYKGENLLELIKLQKGELKCIHCGGLAKYMLGATTPICKERAKLCPGFHDSLSNYHKQKYKDNPELLVQMSMTMLEVQNREEVKRKKSETMLMLHNEDCDKCKEFQKNYRKAKKGPKPKHVD